MSDRLIDLAPGYLHLDQKDIYIPGDTQFRCKLRYVTYEFNDKPDIYKYTIESEKIKRPLGISYWALEETALKTIDPTKFMFLNKRKRRVAEIPGQKRRGNG